MNKRIGVVVMLIWGCPHLGMAQNLPSFSANLASSVPPPLILKDQQIIRDSDHYSLPQPPSKYIDGTTINLINDTDTAPQGMALLDLTKSQTLAQIPVVNKSDRKSNVYYWHPFMGWNFVHYRDGNRQWYGWHTGEAFHWILWRFGRFWWYDNYADRWLYYYQGLWWWQSSKKPVQIQVFMDDGHFHVCNENGMLGDDLMRTGIEEDITTEPSSDSSWGSDKDKTNNHRGMGQLGSDNPAEIGNSENDMNGE